MTNLFPFPVGTSTLYHAHLLPWCSRIAQVCPALRGPCPTGRTNHSPLRDLCASTIDYRGIRQMWIVCYMYDLKAGENLQEQLVSRENDSNEQPISAFFNL